METSLNTPRTSRISTRRWLKTQVKSIWPTLLLILVIHASVLQAFKIPSGSMIPTLLIHDRIFVNKTAYALKLPLSDWFAHKPIYLFRTAEPSRGDVIVFRYPLDPSVYYVKRVIGLPGDVIEMRNKIIWVNGKPSSRAEVESPVAGLRAYLQHYDHTIGTILINDQATHSENLGP